MVLNRTIFSTVCGKPPALANGHAVNYDYEDNLDVIEGEALDYSCGPCYRAMDHTAHRHTMTCSENGTFSPTLAHSGLKCFKFGWCIYMI